MLLKKLKKVQQRVKTLEDSQHFHLDEEEQQIALQAKKQLQACSQQIEDQMQYQKKTLKQSDFFWQANLNTSTKTYVSQNETKSLFCSSRTQNKSNNRKRVEIRVNNSKRRQLAETASQSRKTIQNAFKQQEVNYKKSKDYMSFKASVEKESNNDENKIMTKRHYRTYSINSGSHLKQKMRPFTSRKSNLYINMDETDNYFSRKAYSFNDTIRGNQVSIMEQIQRQSAQNNLRLKALHLDNHVESMPKQKPNTAREFKINLRPEFLKIIEKIKKKQEAKMKRSSVSVKGRRNAV